MRILALDTATRTGWALGIGGRLIESGVQDFSLKRGESPGMRFLRFRRWLGKLVDEELEPTRDLIAYEQAHHRGGAATEVGVGLMTRVMEIAAEYGIEYAGVHTGTLKKHALGIGRGDKSAMVVAARKRWPDAGAILDDNHADALLILSWAIEEYETKPRAAFRPAVGDKP